MGESLRKKYKSKLGISPFGFARPGKSTEKLRKSSPFLEPLFVRGKKNMKGGVKKA